MKVVFLCLLTLSIQAKVFVISDIDDTIKKSNSVSPIGQIYHFWTMKSYPVMARLYHDLRDYYKDEQEVEFSYVSAAPDYLYKQDKWLRDLGFPFGRSYLRPSLLISTVNHKVPRIRKILKDVRDDDIVYFFGDNSSHDVDIYKGIVEELGLKRSFIYIRDVTTEDYLLPNYLRVERVLLQEYPLFYFFSEYELAQILPFLSEQTLVLLNRLYRTEKLVPRYTLLTLSLKLQDLGFCTGVKLTEDKIDCPKALDIFSEYYSRSLL